MVRAISNQNDSALRDDGDFTPGSATKMLPLVRRIAMEMLELNRCISNQREQIRGIDELPQTIAHADYQDELADIRSSLREAEERFEDCRRELAELGLETHLPFDGAIDFPSVLNRRRVQLCWLPDEERVEYWHEVGQTLLDRKKINSQDFGLLSQN